MLKKFYKRTKTRRGLMNVISGVFVILVLTAALNVTIWTVGQQDRINQVVIEKQNADINKLNESIGIADIKVDNNKLNLTITNEGSARATLKSLYVVNETSQQQYRYDLNIAVDGRNSVKDIGQSDPAFPLANDAEYSVRVISESGNTVTARIRPVSEVALPMSLYVIPSTVTTLENVTLLFSVMNNLTDGDVLVGEVTPTLNKTLSCTASAACKFTDYISPTPATIPKGSATLFKWVFQVIAPVGTTMTFNASLTNAKQGNYVIETGRVELVKEVLFTSEVIVNNNLRSKPEVYGVIPGPIGEAPSANKGRWGVVVINPTNDTMTVRVVAINVFSSSSCHVSEKCAPQLIMKDTCAVEGMVPAVGWDCPHDGIVRWQNLADPISISANSAYTFFAKIQSGDLPDYQGGPNDPNIPEPSFLISITVFTNFGQFSRQEYASNMHYNNPTAIPNIYLTNTDSRVSALLDANVLGHVNVTGGTINKRIYVSITDFDTDSATRIESGAVLIINIPKDFVDITLLPPGQAPSGFVNNYTKTSFSDGSTQIKAWTNEHIGDAIGGEAAVFYFDVNVPATGSTKAYAIHAFVDGKVNTSPTFPVGTFGTFGVIVTPGGIL